MVSDHQRLRGLPRWYGSTGTPHLPDATGTRVPTVSDTKPFIDGPLLSGPYSRLGQPKASLTGVYLASLIAMAL